MSEVPEPTALYRVWGDADLLLYIGVSNDFGRRWKEHAKQQPWWDEMKRLTADEWFESRPEAEAAEEAAIKAERPKYNKRHLVPVERKSRKAGTAALPARPAVVLKAIAAWMAGDRAHVPDGRGFMGREWDRFVPPPGAWDECMRVLKPGGHLLAFAGSRTVDLMTLSIRIAGFEIRDSIPWLHGQGYPKSLDVAKAIDRRRNDRPEILKVTSWLADAAEARGVGRAQVDAHMGTSEPGEAWQAAEVIGMEDRFNEPTGIVNAGQGERTAVTRMIKAPNTDAAVRWEGWGTALKPANEPIVVARKPLAAGSVAANVLEYGTGALNIAACKVGTEARVNNAGGVSSLQRVSRVKQGYRPAVTASRNEDSEVSGRWPPNVILTHDPDCGGECAPACPVAELDRQSGVLASGANPARRGSDKFGDAYGEFAGQEECTVYRGADSGGASRFFPAFRYEAKAAASERPRLKDGTAWATVKPVDLMAYLVRLVTPPGGLVLDPFGGSGTTAEACITEGFRCILVEKDPVAAELIKTRLSKPIQPVMFGLEAS